MQSANEELPTLLGHLSGMARFPSGKFCQGSKDNDLNDSSTRSNNEKGLPVRKIQPAALCRMISTTDDVFCHQDSDLYQMICKVAEQLAHSGLPEALEFMRPILDPTVDGTLDLTSNGPERWFVTSWKKRRMKRQQKQGVPVTTTIHLQLLKGELRDLVHTAQSCGNISSPGMHSTIIELTLPGFDRVESKLNIATNNIDTRNLLHMAVLLLNEVYLIEDAMWHDVRGVSSEEDEMTRLVSLLQGYGSDLTRRGEQLISFLQRTKGTDKIPKMREKTWKADNVHAETDALALEAWNLWANARTEKLPEQRDQTREKAAKALELAIKKDPKNYVARSHLIIFASRNPGNSRKERKALEKEALSTLELTVRKDLAYYVARSYLVALMIRDSKLTQAKEQGLKICEELCEQHLVASLSRLGNGARLPIFGLFFQLAAASKISGESTQAIMFAQNAADLFPTDPNPHMMLGELLHAMGAYAESAKECQLALMHHANSSSPAIRHPLMCHAFWSLLPQEYALNTRLSQHIFDTIRMHNFYLTLCCLGASLIHQREFAQAEIFLKKAEHEFIFEDSDTQAMKLLLNLYQIQNRHGEALQYAKKIARIHPKDQEIQEKIKVLMDEVHSTHWVQL
eukprot:gnl/MRDRNA2_/MRDRNA2_84866_c0_seq2.p1 gnl/MRDRNA2_/MRDRNA2_84866_c0~~gnl/MRDRNA2_/MRDRNA2_84866_c0_seq2.p1  ORF type:complete len:627 (-),score=119.81 gnl/MRDRNA2_/MRDRNA2_84866_c0_seq2:269-2149(-)